MIIDYQICAQFSPRPWFQIILDLTQIIHARGHMDSQSLGSLNTLYLEQTDLLHVVIFSLGNLELERWTRVLVGLKGSQKYEHFR